MENKGQLIIDEIKDLMAAVRGQMSLLDAKVVELQELLNAGTSAESEAVLPAGDAAAAICSDGDTVEVSCSPIDIELDDIPEPLEQDEHLSQGLDYSPELSPSLEIPAAGPEPAVVDWAAKGLSEDPVQKPESEPVKMSVPEAVIDALAEKQPWRTDMPGAAVRDIRSAISLNDRKLFIDRLFGENPLRFQETINVINTLDTLEQAVDYLTSAFPYWDLDSDLVYRFMMAVRRRVK